MRGKTLPLADGLIAATALEHDLTLVTRNTKDFSDLGVDILTPGRVLSLRPVRNQACHWQPDSPACASANVDVDDE